MKVAALLLGLCLLSNPYPAEAVTYKWVDEAGKVHLSDRVPAKYKDKAVQIGKQRTNSMGLKEGNDAREQVFRKKALAAHQAKSKLRQAAKQRQRNLQALSPSSNKKPVNTCKAKKAAYDESKACFESCGTRLHNGGVNNSACGHCSNAKRPNC